MPKITPISWQRLEKVFLAIGFEFARQEGSHRCYVKPGISRPVVIPTYDEIPVSIIRSNLKTDGISRYEYFQTHALVWIIIEPERLSERVLSN